VASILFIILDILDRRSCRGFLFNFENIYYFPSCRGEPILLLHSFTPSLPVTHLETLNMKRHGMLVGKFEFNSNERRMWTLPELHYTPKRCHLKRNRFDYYMITSYCSREDPLCTSRLDSRDREIS